MCFDVGVTPTPEPSTDALPVIVVMPFRVVVAELSIGFVEGQPSAQPAFTTPIRAYPSLFACNRLSGRSAVLSPLRLTSGRLLAINRLEGLPRLLGNAPVFRCERLRRFLRFWCRLWNRWHVLPRCRPKGT